MRPIFEYLNYRAFLRDFLAQKKREAAHFSQRYLHLKIGVSPNSGFIANVLSGKKNLTITQAQALARVMKLSRAEAAFFEDLVNYTNARRVEEKSEYLKRLATRQRIELKKLSPDQHSLFAQWYYVMVRELLAFFPVTDNVDEAGAMLEPPVRGGQVREALDELERIGLVRRDAAGRYVQSEAFLSTGDEVRSAELASFQLHMMDMGKRALQTQRAAERDISVVTCALSPSGFAEARELVQEFRKRLLKVAENDRDVDRVYHCNIQLFPVSRKVPQARLPSAGAEGQAAGAPTSGTGGRS